MGKRKTEEDPTTNGDAVESKKRQRLSEEAEQPAAKKLSKEEKQKKKDKKEKKAKKYDKSKAEPVRDEADIVDVAMTEADSIKPEKIADEGEETTTTAAAEGADSKTNGEKAKKKRKKNKKAAAKEDDKTEGDETAAAAENKPAKKNRFIVFVGNLPYSATVADIEKHFSAVQPQSVRLIHEKANPTKSRGIAFLEFSGFDYMKTCLKTMHHSTMTCEGGRDHRGRPKTEERVINVELTAGGGGNTDSRKEKIKAKNEKLNGQRERRAIEEEKQRVKKEQERLAKEGAKQAGADGVHPSRRAYVPGGRR